MHGEIDFDGDLNFKSSYGEQVGNIANEFITIRNPYTGNKRKLLRDIFSALEDRGVKFETMLDLFSGSGVVGLMGKKLGKQVFSNDLLMLPYLGATTLVENDGTLLSKEEKDFLVSNEPESFDDMVRSEYGERFTAAEGLLLDRYRANVDLLFGEGFQLGENFLKKALALVYMCYYVMDRCFVGGRLNNGQVLAGLEHRIKHQRNKGHEMCFGQSVFTSLSEKIIAPGRAKCIAVQHDAVSLLSDMYSTIGTESLDLCYIDPPYGGQQSNYAEMYAFFENYINREPPKVSEEQQRFVSKTDYEENFKQLLSSAVGRFKKIVVSYNDSSWAKIDVIKSCVEASFSSVEVVSMDYEYKYRGKESGKDSPVEYLIIAS